MRQLILPLLVAFGVTMFCGPILLPWLKKLKIGQNVRDDGPQTHLIKSGTPTMGGILILLGLIAGAVLFLRGRIIWTAFAISTTLAFAALGFADDYIKVIKKRSMGLSERQKMIGQIVISLLMALFAYFNSDIGGELLIPFVGVTVDLGLFYIPFTVFVVVAIVNSVNFTDGLDGLASSVTFLVAACFSIIAYVMGNDALASGNEDLAYLYYNVASFGAAACGGCLAFLRYNSYPAMVFMGDTGSLMLGGVVSVMAILTRMQLLIPLVGGMYMMGTVSVIIQRAVFKRTRKRVFRMAPLHHHFELLGMHETRVVAMYAGITLILCIIGLIAI